MANFPAQDPRGAGFDPRAIPMSLDTLANAYMQIQQQKQQQQQAAQQQQRQQLQDILKFGAPASQFTPQDITFAGEGAGEAPSPRAERLRGLSEQFRELGELELRGKRAEVFKAEDLILDKLAGGESLKPQEKIRFEDTLGKRFEGLSKDYLKQRDSFARVKASAQEPSAAGDLALIFNYMKILDPGSVVRESEFANAAATGSFGERLKAAGQKIIAGERLSDEMRKDFLNRAGKLFNEAQKIHDDRKKQFRGLADRWGLKPENVVIDVRFGEPEAPTGASPITPDIKAQASEILKKRRGQ
jgi:uncharacterized protein YaiI (UPF0178 family)